MEASHRPGYSMAEFKAVIADSKSGKTYKRDITGQFANSLVGRKLGEEIDGLFVGLPGYKLAITGGGDKNGFPMPREFPRPRGPPRPPFRGVGFPPPPAGRATPTTGRRATLPPPPLALY